MMLRCNAMSALVDNESAAASASVGVTTYMPVQMVLCNAMAWTDETEGLLKYPIQKVTEIYKKVTEPYNYLTELENSSWNILYLLRSEVAYIGTGHILP